MPNFNDDFFNKTLQREMAFLRYEQGVSKRVLNFLVRQERITQGRILSNYRHTDLSKRRLRLIRRHLRQRQRTIRKQAFRIVGKEIDIFAIDEARFLNDLARTGGSAGFGINTALPAKEQILASVYNTAYNGQTFRKWFTDYNDASFAGAAKSIQQSFTQGETLDALQKRLRLKSRQDQYRMRALLRTTLTHTRTKARETWAQSNGFTFRRYTAILDVRTTYICGSLDGRVYNSQVDNYPTIPQHINCRSTYIFVANPNDVQGERIALNTKNRDFRKNQREIRRIASRNNSSYIQARGVWAKRNIGRVPAKTSYRQWFDQRPASFQRSYLGQARYKAYSQGKLQFQDLVDPITARPINLKQLRRMGKL